MENMAQEFAADKLVGFAYNTVNQYALESIAPAGKKNYADASTVSLWEVIANNSFFPLPDYGGRQSGRDHWIINVRPGAAAGFLDLYQGS